MNKLLYRQSIKGIPNCLWRKIFFTSDFQVKPYFHSLAPIYYFLASCVGFCNTIHVVQFSPSTTSETVLTRNSSHVHDAHLAKFFKERNIFNICTIFFKEIIKACLAKMIVMHRKMVSTTILTMKLWLLIVTTHSGVLLHVTLSRIAATTALRNNRILELFTECCSRNLSSLPVGNTIHLKVSRFDEISSITYQLTVL